MATNNSTNYVATGPISVPLSVNLNPDVDLNGLKFSYQHGIFYSPVSQNVTLKLPPTLSATEQSQQYKP
jgi:hypothetical protein